VQISSVDVLPLCGLRQGKPITPSKVIPVVHVKRQGNNIGLPAQLSNV